MKAIGARDRPGLGSLSANVIVFHVDDLNRTVHLQSLCQGLNAATKIKVSKEIKVGIAI